MVQGGVLQPDERHVLDLPDAEQHCAEQHAIGDGNQQRQLYDCYDTATGYTDPTNYLTPVGVFAGSPGPYGTYDMGGDVFQWNEANITNGSIVVCVAGSGTTSSVILASSIRFTTRPDGRVPLQRVPCGKCPLGLA